MIHVIDCNDPDRRDNIEQVNHVLAEIGADTIPVLKVYNKLDLLEDREPRLDRDEDGVPQRVWVSAQAGLGLDLLYDAIAELLGEELVHGDLVLPHAGGKLRALLYEQNAVQSESTDEQGMTSLSLRLQKSDYDRLVRMSGLNPDELELIS